MVRTPWAESSVRSASDNGSLRCQTQNAVSNALAEEHNSIATAALIAAQTPRQNFGAGSPMSFLTASVLRDREDVSGKGPGAFAFPCDFPRPSPASSTLAPEILKPDQ